MTTKLHALLAVALLVLALALFAGCAEDSQATAPLSGTSADASSTDLASAIVQSELAQMASGGMNADSAKGIFSLNWREVFRLQEKTFTLAGHARAVGFDGSVSGANGRRRGIDMGSVTLRYSSGEITLHKHTGPDGGVAYASFSGRRRNESGAANIPFLSGGTYEFNVSGSSKFSALTATITAPSALLSVSAPAHDATISASGDLTVAWQGGSESGKILLVVAAEPERPSGGPPQGGPDRSGPPQGGGAMPPPGGPRGGGGMMPQPPMDDRPPMPDSSRAIIVRIDGNPGSYTISASALENLVQKTGAKSLRCEVSQVTVQDVLHDGSVVHLVLRNGDGARVTLQ